MRYITKLILLFCWVLASEQVHAQTFDIEKYNKSLFNVNFKNKAEDFKVWNETPPVVLKDGDKRLYISTTFFSSAWEHHQNLATPIDDQIIIPKLKQRKRYYITSSLHWWDKFYDPEFLESKEHLHQQEWQEHHWKRNYNGVFSAHLLPIEGGTQKIIFALSHGENKNERIGDYFYQNTIRPSYKIDELDAQTYSGGVPYADCWEAYFGFLNGNWAGYGSDLSINPTYFHDIGPVAWPSAGYVSEDGRQLSHGLRHPSSIVHGDYVYIYVMDASLDGTGGVKLVRVKTVDVLKPQMYETWANNKWIPALPEGFLKENIQKFFSQKGPANTPVFPNMQNTVKFSVARFSDTTDEFIGVEEFIDRDNTVQVAFRFSKDLINWSERVTVYKAESWKASTLKYPVFMNVDGLTNGLIDKNEFYLIGSKGDGNISKLYFKFIGVNPEQNTAADPDTGNASQYLDSRLRSNELEKQVSRAKSTFSEISVFPVPVSTSMDVNFKVEELSRISLNLYNSRGILIENLFEETFLPQITSRTFYLSYLAPGVYYLILADDETSVTKRIIKL